MKRTVRITESQLREMIRKALNEQPTPNQDIDLYASECLQDKEKYKVINTLLDNAKSDGRPVSAAFRVINAMLPGNPYSETLMKELRLLGNCMGMKGMDTGMESEM